MSDVDEHDSYHYDFTTASEWEIFIARLEEVIHEWKLPHKNHRRSRPLAPSETGTNGPQWKAQTELLSFAGAEFTLSRYHTVDADLENEVSLFEEEIEEETNIVVDDLCLLCTEQDFVPQLNADTSNNGTIPLLLVRWYGLRDFLVLAPAAHGQLVSSESKAKILLSSILIAINNSHCYVPVFVQVHERKQMYYIGVCEGRGIRTDFEMVHLRRTPSHCKYLTGLLNMFKTKVGSPLPLEPVTVSVRFEYLLSNWTSNVWMQDPPDFDFLQGHSIGVAEFGNLPFGAIFDPISELHLYATWPQLVENSVVDSESYSDFEPSQAPQWSVRAVMAEQPACLLNEYLSEFVQLCSSNRSMHDLLGDMVDKGGPNLSSSLNLLTESRVPTISKVIKKAKGHRQEVKAKIHDGPISEELLMPILYFLFPDADDKPRNPFPDSVGNPTGAADSFETGLSGLKSAPVGSLVWRLAVVMSHVVHTLGGVKAAAHVWYEFVQEMRFRWERTIHIPGVAPGFPDPRTCLLHQKLQMLNCCVARKMAREQLGRDGSVEADDTDTDSEEEFFDCSDEDQDMKDASDVVEKPTSKRRSKHSLWNQPVGRLQKHGNMRLVNTKEHLYIPFTQEATPKTEDQVEEDAEVLLQLGTGAQGAELRARMMSASLLSDMESFKAANPGAILDDFIRWYSPRDWIEVDGTDEYGERNGVLSARMQIKGNTWMEVWEAAKPVPARRQKRLFDDTREAEKVLHFLDSRKPSSVAELLLPVLTHAAICRAKLELRDDLPAISTKLQNVSKCAERLTRSPKPNLKRYEDLASEIANVETTIAQANSLKLKFADPAHSMECTDLDQFLLDVMQLPEVLVPGGPRGHIGRRIQAMFSEAQKALHMIIDSEPLGPHEDSWALNSSNFPRPSSREFIMRVTASRPAPYSAPTVQRMYATLKKEEFRLAGCFSQDTTLM